MLRAPLPTTLNYYLAIHSNHSFWIVQKDQASLSAVRPTTPRRPVQTGRLHSNHSFWIVQKDQASLSAVRPTTPRRPVQTGRLPVSRLTGRHCDTRSVLTRIEPLRARR